MKFTRVQKKRKILRRKQYVKNDTRPIEKCRWNPSDDGGRPWEDQSVYLTIPLPTPQGPTIAIIADCDDA